MLDYDKIIGELNYANLDAEQLDKLIDTISNTASSRIGRTNRKDVFTRIAEKSSCTESMKEKMLLNLIEILISQEDVSEFANYLTKDTFDKVWYSDQIQQYNRYLPLVYSKHTDGDQLKTVYDKHVKAKNKTVSHKWQKDLKSSILSHPNCPSSILIPNAKGVDNAIDMASNPNLPDNVLKIIGGLTLTAAVLLKYILENLSLDWTKIAYAVEMGTHLERFRDGNMHPQTRQVLIDFFKRDDATEKGRATMFKLTGDEYFLPQSAKDIFLF